MTISKNKKAIVNPWILILHRQSTNRAPTLLFPVLKWEWDIFSHQDKWLTDQKKLIKAMQTIFSILQNPWAAWMKEVLKELHSKEWWNKTLSEWSKQAKMFILLFLEVIQGDPFQECSESRFNSLEVSSLTLCHHQAEFHIFCNLTTLTFHAIRQVLVSQSTKNRI